MYLDDFTYSNSSIKFSLSIFITKALVSFIIINTINCTLCHSNNFIIQIYFSRDFIAKEINMVFFMM